MIDEALNLGFISSCLHVYLLGLDSSVALKMPTERPIKNSDRKKKLDFKIGTSRDKITYKAIYTSQSRGILPDIACNERSAEVTTIG